MSFKLEIIENQRAIQIIAKYAVKATDFLTLCDGMDISRRRARELLLLDAEQRTKVAFSEWESLKEHTAMEFIAILNRFGYRQLADQLGFPFITYGPRRLVKLEESNEFRMEMQRVKVLIAERQKLQRHVEKLQKKFLRLLEEIVHENMLCCICMERQKNTVLSPCNHLCVCSACSFALIPSESLCPICRGTVKSSMRVYL